MVKKARKRELKKLAIVQQTKINKKIHEKRALRGLPAPTPGQSFSHIKNKMRRSQMVRLMKTEKKRLKTAARRGRNEAEERGEEVTRGTQKTTDLMREADETIVPPDDSEVEGDEELDEFNKYFTGNTKPKVLMTTQKAPTKTLFNLMKELIHVIPNTFYYPRRDFEFKKICEYAGNKGFTDIILFAEKGKAVTGMYICHLPKGPTSFWRLTRLKLGQEMKGSATCNATHNPELILNNFTTRLGRRVGRQLAALFPQKPDFNGRRTVTFHNQRDFVFFRHYRYAFKADGTKCKLQEIGPRFTLKCRFLQHGLFDAKAGEFEYIWRPDSQVSRKRFFV
uniref:Brix domain-containing protein n=1 Tax=Alexandrium catenella TaxID=2925 RepID=A0A7S1KZ06_ALECA|mmetsp:Transcript_103262/g.274628  ORF Transcript_103262/g.274628 Transcript_103262/m.274628 type:complete len:337 (+) Transcript_103262:68-1078(+)